MDVHFLGTRGHLPSPYGEHTSCVVMPEHGLVFDAGTGICKLRPHIQKHWLMIFLSHLHDDHSHGLTYLLALLHRKKVQHVFLGGRAPFREYVDNLFFKDPRFPVTLEQHGTILSGVAFHTIDVFDDNRNTRSHPPCWRMFPAGSMVEMQVYAYALPHPSGGVLAYDVDFIHISRREVIKRVVYCTDTTLDVANGPVLAFVQGLTSPRTRRIDLFIVEGNFSNCHEEIARITGHSTSAMVADVMRMTQPRRVALTHTHGLSDDPYDNDFFEEDWTVFREVSLALGGQDMLVILAREGERGGDFVVQI